MLDLRETSTKSVQGESEQGSLAVQDNIEVSLNGKRCPSLSCSSSTPILPCAQESNGAKIESELARRFLICSKPLGLQDDDFYGM
jgi:hypothetical protein